MTTRPTKLFLDLETSGLRPMLHHVLEVGLVAIDDDYNELGAASILVPVGHQIMMENMDDVVLAMHTENGLLAELAACEQEVEQRRHTLPAWAYRQATTECAAFLTRHGYPLGEVILCGNSIHFDRAFIEERLPGFGACLSYRMRDFSGIEKFLREDCQVALPASPQLPHRGLADARLELEHARANRSIIRREFGDKPLPSLTSQFG